MGSGMEVCSIFMEMQTMFNAGFVDFAFTGVGLVPMLIGACLP